MEIEMEAHPRFVAALRLFQALAESKPTTNAYRPPLIEFGTRFELHRNGTVVGSVCAHLFLLWIEENAYLTIDEHRCFRTSKCSKTARRGRASRLIRQTMCSMAPMVSHALVSKMGIQAGSVVKPPPDFAREINVNFMAEGCEVIWWLASLNQTRNEINYRNIAVFSTFMRNFAAKNRID